MGRQVFTAGEILTAANMNDLGDQTVMVFDDATDRATAIPTPVEGMVTYLKDTDSVEVFDGSNFVPVAIEPDPPAILQVVQTVKTDKFSTTSTTFEEVTGLSASITPSSTSSKIMVLATLSGGVSVTTGNGLSARVSGGNAGTFVGDTVGSNRRFSFAAYTDSQGDFRIDRSQMSLIMNFVDSPATAAPVTYAVEIRNNVSGFVTVNSAGQDSDTTRFSRTVSTLILMEVAG